MRLHLLFSASMARCIKNRHFAALALLSRGFLPTFEELLKKDEMIVPPMHQPPDPMTAEPLSDSTQMVFGTCPAQREVSLLLKL